MHENDTISAAAQFLRDQAFVPTKTSIPPGAKTKSAANGGCFERDASRVLAAERELRQSRASIWLAIHDKQNAIVHRSRWTSADANQNRAVGLVGPFRRAQSQTHGGS
jgi:hypothetical protein